MFERYYQRTKMRFGVAVEGEPLEYKTIYFDEETNTTKFGKKQFEPDEADDFLAQFGWITQINKPPAPEAKTGLTPEQAADRLNWLIKLAGSQLEYGVVYDWEKEIGDVIKVDQRSVDVLREISRVSRELANHYEEKL